MAASGTPNWRKRAVAKAKGPYWQLMRGSARDGNKELIVGLGYVTEAEAEAARDRMAEEQRRPWIPITPSGMKLETNLSVADYIVHLWTHGEPPFPTASLEDFDLEPSDAPDVQAMITTRREAIRGYLLDATDWRDIARLGQVELPPRLMLLRDYYERHYKEWRSNHRPRSWRQEEGHWRRILRPSPAGLGDVALGDIDAHNVADYVEGLLIERARPGEGVMVGDKASGAIKKLHKSDIRELLKRAFRMKHIDTMPDLAIFTVEDSNRRVRAQEEPLNLEEVRRVLDHTRTPLHRGLFGLGIGEGLRPSELSRVRWEDIELPSIIRIRGDADGKGKTDLSVATIPMTPLAADELERWWIACGKPTSGLAFPSPKTGEAYGESGYKKSLATAARRAGITRKVTPYLLRHTTATICWELDIPMDVARRILRHADESMLREVYARPRPGAVAKHLEDFRLPK